MSIAESRQRLRDILSGSTCVTAAPVHDALSARIAEVAGFDVVRLASAVLKMASLALPDEAFMTEISDLVDVCRRVARVTDASVIVDADDCGSSALAVRRFVRDFEDAGASGIEIQDQPVFQHSELGRLRHEGFLSKEAFIGKLKAAVAARRDPNFIIIARTHALEKLPKEEALDRIRDYCQTGVDAFFPPGLPDITALQAIRQVTSLPLIVNVGIHDNPLGTAATQSSLPHQIERDQQYFMESDIRIRFVGHPDYRAAVKAMYDTLKYLKEGGSVFDVNFAERQASWELMEAITNTADHIRWEQTYYAP
jgi:oxaloacetate decarboxylase